MAKTTQIKILGKGSPEKLGSKYSIRTFLYELIELLEMRILGEPIIYEVALDIEKLGKVPFEDEGGISGTAVLSTSHCCVHCWELRSEFHLDIYSCREFNMDMAVSFVKDYFSCYEIKVCDLSFSNEW